jgi:hypothetical protein
LNGFDSLFSAPLNDPSVHGTHDSEHLPYVFWYWKISVLKRSDFSTVGVQRFMAAPLDAASDMDDGVDDDGIN